MRTPLTESQKKFLDWVMTYKQDSLNNQDKLTISNAVWTEGFVTKVAKNRLNEIRERFISDYEIRKY